MKSTCRQIQMPGARLLIFILAFAGFLLVVKVPATVSAQDPAVTPAAVIDKIVFNETSQTEAFGNVTVTRANGERVQSVSTGLLLYRGDVIETARNTKVTVLFLESPVPEKHNEVIIDGDAKVGISSTDSWWGRVWVKVKGLFGSKTTYVQVGARGTEYELTVDREKREAKIVVLEGAVDVTRGSFALVGRAIDVTPPDRLERAALAPRFVPASFNFESRPQQQSGRALDVPAGQVTSYEVVYNIFNECKERHRFEFRTSDNTPWLQLVVQRVWDIEPAQRLQIKATLNIDATILPAGAQRGSVYVICLDCEREQQCPGRQLEWPYSVSVSGPPPSPTPPPSPSPSVIRNFRLNELEESTVPESPQPAAPVRASDGSVLTALDWTNNVILKTQPSYSAEGIIPHFANAEQRNQIFRTAREQAILRQSPGSNKTLGDVYSDWGKAAWASHAYDREGGSRGGQPTPSDAALVDRAEAYRLTGRLEQARNLARTPGINDSPALNNLFGNIYKDYARIDLDKRDWTQARTNLERAEQFYRLASARTVSTAGPESQLDVARSNLAQTQIAQGDLILKQATTSALGQQGAELTPAGSQNNAPEQARARYSAATQSLANAQPIPNYPFDLQARGRAHQGLGDAAKLAGQATAATESYARARSEFNRIVSAYPDCAEGYFSLGDLEQNLGNLENAESNYRRAIKARPDQPASYYPLAMLLQDKDLRLAAALAAMYLKLEPEVFKQGEKAQNATRISRGEKVPLPPRIGTSPTRSASVPGVVDKLLAQATRELESAGYSRGSVETRPDARPQGTVINQSPAAGTTAAPASPVNLIVSSGPGPAASRVPNLRDMALAQATRELETAGYRRGNVETRADASPQGTVIGQSPVAGTSAPPLSSVNLIVSSGLTDLLVPDVRDRSLAEATRAIEAANLRVGRVTEKPDNNKQKGIVLKQRPEGGKKAVAGSPVDLEVATSKPVEVPDIVGEREESVRKKLLDKRLSVGNISQRPSCDAVGKVIEQNPIKKTPVEVGHAVDYVVGSLGDNPITVPQFVGRSQRDAMIEIRERRFTLSRVRPEETDNAQPGTVMEQEPREGTQVAQGCPVKIEIKVAEPLTTVGNYVGLPEAQARQQVSSTRLFALVRARESRGEPGMVIDQSPPAGSRVKRSSPVTLFVSRAVVFQNIPVPDVRGRSTAEARRILEASGLRLGTVSQGRMYSEQYPRGSIESQDPGAGQSVPAGTPVNVVLSPRGMPTEPEGVLVPEVIGKRLDEAKLLIEGSPRSPTTLKMSVIAESRPGVNECTVWNQKPGANSRVPRGETVTIWIVPCAVIR